MARPLTALFQAAFALALAAVAWGIVTWVQNPFREDWLSSPLTIEVTHLPPGLVQVGSLGQVRVRIRAGQDAWGRVQPTDFKASADLSKLTAGIHTVDIKIDKSPEYDVVDWTPKKVTVRLEPLEQRSIPVQLQLTGKLADGYVLSGQSVTPDQIGVSGQQDLVDSVAQAAITMDLGGVRGDETDTMAPQLLDENGQAVKNLQLSPDSVRVSLQVDRQIGDKTVPVRITTTGQVAPGYGLTSLVVSPPTLMITGGPAAVGQVDSIDLPPLDLGGAKSNIERASTVPNANGYSIVGSSDVQVTATIQPLRTTAVLPVGITVRGANPGMQVQVSPVLAQVTLGGTAPALAAVTGDQLSAVADLSGLGPGEHNVQLKFNAPSSVSIDAAQPSNATVTLVGPPTPTSTPVSPSPSATPVPASATPSPSVATSHPASSATNTPAR